MGRDLILEHLGGRDLNFRAVSIQKVVVEEMASTDHRCTGGGGVHPLALLSSPTVLTSIAEWGVGGGCSGSVGRCKNVY